MCCTSTLPAAWCWRHWSSMCWTDALPAGGRKARPWGVSSDSLADVISFGVAPAVIAYGCGMQGCTTALCWLTLWPAAYRAWRATTSRPSSSRATMARCVILRARPFHVHCAGGRAGAGRLAGRRARPALGRRGGAGGFTLHPLVLLFALSGSLMISRLRIPKL